MKKSQNLKKMTLFALFLAIEMMLLMTPFGYLRIGPISATLMHIPVILGAIFLGTGYGAALGLVFGITSVINATMQPGITSFVFSPFVTIGGMSGNFMSLVIAIGPRVLLGVISGVLFQLFSKKWKSSTSAMLAAGIATACHTIMVLGMIVLFFGADYSSAVGIAQNALIGVMAYTVLTNGVMEIIIASLCAMALTKAIPVYSIRPAKVR